MIHRHKLQGFTLIELLVVVLIIGILAAVALPQYQRAVEKARMVEALTTIKSLVPAIEEYILANGTFPTEFTELSITPPNILSTNHTKAIGRYYSYVLINGRLDVGSTSSGTTPFLWISHLAPDFSKLGGNHHLYCYYTRQDSAEVKARREALCRSVGGKDPIEMPSTKSMLFPLD